MTKKLVVGLGNPGKKYEHTRHNLGARVAEVFAKDHPDSDVLLPQPGVFMNEFGTLLPKGREMIIVHDDIELSLGQMKFTAGGSAKGHNGVRSVHAALGTTEIPRLRLGVGRPSEGVEVDEYVLGKFTEEEEAVVEEVTRQAVEWLFNYCSFSSPEEKD